MVGWVQRPEGLSDILRVLVPIFNIPMDYT